MPHIRKRYLADAIPKTMAFSPIVGILGHRQVGKTTLAECIGQKYISLDGKEYRELAQNDPYHFLKVHHSTPLVIDECQKAPALFDELKDWVRKHKRPGQFLLTGSVRFTSKKAIRESLTGRIIYHELLPFTVSEIERRPLPGIVRSLMKTRNLVSWLENVARNAYRSSSLVKTIDNYQRHGGLPGVFFIRNEKLRIQKINDQLQTILDRDLREVVATRLSFAQILEFSESLAKQEGVPVSYTRLLRDTGVAAVSAKALIAAFEAVFLIRLLKVEGGKKGWIYYFEDHAESLHLSAYKLDHSIYYSGFLYRNIRAEFMYAGEHHFRFFHYLTRHNTTLPFAIEWDGKYLGFLPLKSSQPAHAEIMAAQSFLKRYNDSKVMMLHPDSEMRSISDRIVLLPDWALF
ncbi:MAG: AAA family ATPase [Bdellovibrionota bacterium]